MRNCDSQVQTVERMNKGATIVEAVKLAKEMEPESVAVGEMPHCLHLKPDTPSDVLRWCLRRSLARGWEESGGMAASQNDCVKYT